MRTRHTKSPARKALPSWLQHQEEQPHDALVEGIVLDLPWNRSTFAFSTTNFGEPDLGSLAAHGVVALRNGTLKLLYAVGNESWYAAEVDSLSCPADAFMGLCDTSTVSLGPNCANAFLFDLASDAAERRNLYLDPTRAGERAALERRAVALLESMPAYSASYEDAQTKRAAQKAFYQAGDYVVPWGCAAEY